MVDTDKEKKVRKADYKGVIKTWLSSCVVMLLFMLIAFAVSQKSMVRYQDTIYPIIVLYMIMSIGVLIMCEKEGITFLAKPIILVFAVIVPCISAIDAKDISQKSNTGVESSIFDLATYDSRYDIILPNDVIKQNGLTLYDTMMMSEALKKAYPDDGFDLVLFESVEQEGEILNVTVKSNLNYRYVISINLSTKVVDSNISRSDATEVKTLTEMGEPIYSFTPDEKANFEAYLTDNGRTGDVSICSIEELNCCYYIYFTDNGKDSYVRIDKKTNKMTESGDVVNGERTNTVKVNEEQTASEEKD